jgi:hypothetical protein
MGSTRRRAAGSHELGRREFGLRSLVATRARKALVAVVGLLLAGSGAAIAGWIRSAGESATKRVLPSPGGQGKAALTIRVARPGTFDSASLPFPYYVVPKDRFRSPYAISASARNKLFSPQYLDDDWAKQHGAVAGSPQVVRLELRGQSDEPILVNAIQPEIVGRKTPVKGWYIAAGGCGIGPMRTAEINLDASPPTVGYYASDASPMRRRLTLSVTRTDPEQVELHVITRRAMMDWRAKIFYSAPDGDGVVTIDDNGRPFRVTSETSSDGYEAIGDTIKREHYWDADGISMC